jgi:hypothetical protein
MHRVRMTFVGLLVSSIAWLLMAVGAADAQAPIWTWTNQYGSTLAITNFNTTTGAITGTYTNQATNSCDSGVPQPAVGWLVAGTAGTAISFTVNFAACNSTTVWTGQLNAAFGFQTLWLLSLAEAVTWNGISAGSDTFTFTNGDQAKLMSAEAAKGAAANAGEKLSNIKK